jgi:hypothetical protein
MEIDLGKVPFTMDFHPSDNLVTAGLITGDLHLLVYSSLSLGFVHGSFVFLEIVFCICLV